MDYDKTKELAERLITQKSATNIWFHTIDTATPHTWHCITFTAASHGMLYDTYSNPSYMVLYCIYRSFACNAVQNMQQPLTRGAVLPIQQLRMQPVRNIQQLLAALYDKYSNFLQHCTKRTATSCGAVQHVQQLRADARITQNQKTYNKKTSTENTSGC
jgi:hypothetical protein